MNGAGSYRQCPRIILVPIALVLTFSMADQGFAGVSGSSEQSPEPVQGPSNQPTVPETTFKRETVRLNWETGEGRSYLIPGVELLSYLFLLNQYDRHFTEPKDIYRTTPNTFREHLTDSKWVLDNDQFSVNQFLHPYGGSVYYGLARSTGLNFWESFLYSTAGSFLWEMGGEKTDPSINDMITTPIGGTFLGEPFFRMANLLLASGGGKPGFWRELGAAVISPPTGFNRLVFGERFDAESEMAGRAGIVFLLR